MRREIGSEFWDVPVCGKLNQLFPKSTQWFLSGRSALQAIIKDLPGAARSVSLPSWCCDSMIKPFVDAGIEVHFYPVHPQDGRLIQEIRLDSDVLFVMDYFGYSSDSKGLECYRGIIIRDVTHSIFSASYPDAAYCFGSLRKWCGVWTGGYAWTGDGHELTLENSDDHGYVPLREKGMNLKNRYIHGRSVTNKKYLEIFEEAEEVLERVGIAPAAERDVSLAKQLDIDFIKSRRRANAKLLMEAFPDWLIFAELRETDCPMFVPILVPDGRRDELRRFLIKNDIYCPIHWPESAFHRLDQRKSYIYQNELSLVCDQRYTEEDMKRLIDTIKLWEVA